MLQTVSSTQYDYINVMWQNVAWWCRGAAEVSWGELEGAIRQKHHFMLFLGGGVSREMQLRWESLPCRCRKS